MTPPADAPRQTVGTAELRAALEDVLSSYFGTQCRIARLERRPTRYYYSFAIEELGVRLDDGMTVELLFKDLSWQALLEAARRVKPAFLYNPLREIETYRVILAPHCLGTATCYGAVVDHPVGHYWLFLEKVAGLELHDFSEVAIWQQVARWLALMHARFVGETETLAREVPLLNYDGDYYRLWLRRARAFLRQAGRSQPGDVRWHGIEWLAERYDRVVERLVALPVTFIHGEFYASNVLVQEAVEELRVCPIDWEMAAVGPGLMDLAALTAGRGWTADEKTALALAYHGALVPHDGWPPATDAFLAALDYCRLHLAIQWLGWSSEWSPPPDHTQNWLGEALSLAEKLEL